MTRNKQAQSRVPRPRSPGWMFSARSIHLFIGRPFHELALLRCGHRLSNLLLLRGCEKHYLFIHIVGSKFSIVPDLQGGCPAPRIVAAEHASIDQEHLVSETRPDAPTFLRRVAYRNLTCLEGVKNLAHLCCTFFFAPLVITAKPQWTINLDAEPLSVLVQELNESGLALLVGRYPRLALSDDLRLDKSGNFLNVKKWENYLLVLQILFEGIEGLDFIANLRIDLVKSHFGHVRTDSAVQEDHSSNLGYGRVLSQPLSIDPV